MCDLGRFDTRCNRLLYFLAPFISWRLPLITKWQLSHVDSVPPGEATLDTPSRADSGHRLWQASVAPM